MDGGMRDTLYMYAVYSLQSLEWLYLRDRPRQLRRLRLLEKTRRPRSVFFFLEDDKRKSRKRFRGLVSKPDLGGCDSSQLRDLHVNFVTTSARSTDYCSGYSPSRGQGLL